jgi:hypothetical protein
MRAETDGHVTMAAWDGRPGLGIGRPISARQRGRRANDRVNIARSTAAVLAGSHIGRFV